MDEFMRTTIDGILENPQKNFPRFLFGSDVLATVDLLNELVIIPRDGHRIVVECLLCWQDLMEHTYGLEPIVLEISHADDPHTVEACMKLINNLLNLAPNAVAKIRIRHELNELQFDDRILTLREKFPDHLPLHQELQNWNSIRDSSIALEEITCRTDADSGTFSGEEDDMVSNSAADFNGGGDDPVSEMESSLQALMDKFLELLNYEMSKDDRNLVVDTFMELLKQLASKLKSNSLSGPLPLVLGSIKSSFDSAYSKNQSSKPPAAPPPPPPPFLIKTPKISTVPPSAPPPPPTLKTPSAPPPPPLSRINGLTPVGKSPIVYNGATKQLVVSIPNSLKPKAVPPNGKKFKLLQWTKIPETAIVSENHDRNIWQRMENIDLDTSLNLDFTKLDDYFASNIYDSTPTTKATIDKKTSKKPETVSLLSSKRSMNIGIFLKQFKNVDSLLKSISEGKNDLIDLEKLKMLTTLLPDAEECSTLRGYTGDMSLLGHAECFLLKLLAINEYKTRIEAMLLREEFSVLIKNITPQLVTIINAGKELKSSRSLQKVLLVLLHMGNYLNHGANTGNAVGFKLNSLWMIADLRANKGGGITLLHLIGQQLSDIVDDLKEELTSIKEAAGLTLETIRTDVTNIDKRIKTLENQLKNKEDPFSVDASQFLKSAKNELTSTFAQINELEQLRKDLAVYFCENEKTFRLEECFKIFNTFLTRFYAAIQENKERDQRESRKRAKKLKSTSSLSLNSALDGNGHLDSVKAKNSDRHSALLESNKKFEGRNVLQKIEQIHKNSSKIDSKAYMTSSLSRIRPKEPATPEMVLIKDTDHLEAFVDKELSLRENKKTFRPSILQSDLWKKPEIIPTQKPKEFNKITVHVSSDSSAYSSDTSPTNRRSEETELSHDGSSDYGIALTSTPSPEQKISHVKVVYTSELTPIKSKIPEPERNEQKLVHVPISYDEPTKVREMPSTVGQKKTPQTTEGNNATMTIPALNPVTRKSTLRSVRAQQSNLNDSAKYPSSPLQKTSPSLVKAAQRVAVAASVGKVRSMTAKYAKATEASQNSTPVSRKTSDSSSRPTSTKTSTSSSPRTSITTAKLPLRNSTVQRTTGSNVSVTPPARQPLARSSPPSSFKDPSRRSVPMSAAEKRRTMMTRNDSVSTAARPALIKTGSKTSNEVRPKWI